VRPSRGNAYEKIDLPILATAFSEHWDVYVCPKGSNLTPTVLSKVKEEIIALLVASYVVSPPNGYGTVAQRSERIAVQDTGRADAHNVVPALSNKRRITLPPPREEVNDNDDDDDEDVEMMDTDDDAVKLQKKWLEQFNLETLKHSTYQKVANFSFSSPVILSAMVQTSRDFPTTFDISQHKMRRTRCFEVSLNIQNPTRPSW